jgi:anti-sigma-K factor RskA
MSSPEPLQRLIAGYVLGTLDLEEAKELEQLLIADATIAAKIAQMQKTLELAYAPPEVLPPARLRSAILAKAYAGHSANSLATPSAGYSSWRTWGKAIAVAAAALIAALGIANYRLWQALQTAQNETQATQAALAYSLQATAANNSATATVKVNPATLEGTIAVQNLPPLPPGQTYVLWTVLQPNAPFTVDAKGAILTKAFQVDDRGSFSQTITMPEVYRQRNLVAKVAVTVEQAIAPQQHSGSPILISGL